MRKERGERGERGGRERGERGEREERERGEEERVYHPTNKAKQAFLLRPELTN